MGSQLTLCLCLSPQNWAVTTHTVPLVPLLTSVPDSAPEDMGPCSAALACWCLPLDSRQGAKA